MTREIPIHGDTIRLGQLLKLAGVVDSGSEVKALLAGAPALVNGEPEGRRGAPAWRHGDDRERRRATSCRVNAST